MKAAEYTLAVAAAALFVMSIALTFLRKGVWAEVCLMAGAGAAAALLALASQA
jgi:hypothetical protein